MADRAAIEAPFTLASLPKPFDPTVGTTYAAPVFGLRGQKWRKRPEIVASVDGDSITIYNVRNPRLVTSYALPPQTRLLCAPCSIYRKITGRKAAQRVTYAVLGHTTGKKTEVICFTEDTIADSTDLSADLQVKTSYQLPTSTSTVFAINALASHSDNETLGLALDIAVTYSDGSVECIAGDLQQKRWDADAARAIVMAESDAEPSSVKVEYATVTDVTSARKGLLKSREDALALLGGTVSLDNSTDLNTPLLAMVTVDDQNTRRFNLFSLPSRSKDMITSAHQGLRYLFSYDLPTIPSSDKATFSLQSSAGKLHQLLSGIITTYDLSGTVPRLLSVLTPHTESHQSFVRISAALVLVAESTSCAIYDTKYNSLQAALSLESDPLETAGDKRKRTEGATEGSLDFVTFFSDLGMAVAISGNALVGLQINLSATAYKKSKANTSLLINSLGKGSKKALVAAPDSEVSSQEWESWKETVDSLVDSDVAALERFLAAELELSSAPKQQKSAAQESEAQNGEDNRMWPVRDSRFLVQKTERRKAVYLLSKMFAWNDATNEDQSSISMNFFAANIFRWLSVTGYMSAMAVERALRETGAIQSTAQRVHPGDIMKAVNELDTEMHVMHEWLSWPVYLEIEEVIVALASLVKSLQGPSPAAVAKLITSKSEESGNELETTIQAETDAAEADLEFALSALDTGLSVRSASFRTVFTRLHSFPSRSIVERLRTHLAPREVVFFIQILRIELADGGWTSKYTEDEIAPRSEDAGSPSDHSIAIISNLLNCAIDAIGTSGWLVGLSGDPDLQTDNMLETLVAETSAALETCIEACSFGVFLNDFERFSNTIHASQKQTTIKKVDPIKTPGFEETPLAVDPILPLGYKAQGPANKMRMTSTGQVEKSRGLRGKELSMRVGKYSLDRIVV
ncbi:hypothetical protein E4T48_01457 [Aureobasidium sp. EXF-10727]|nr:hypothetical protein E4T48_01457 [Aureobasidium sp. EXF-10727]